MTDQTDKFWNRFADGLRRRKGLCLETSEWADAAFRDAPEAALSSDDVGETLRKVLSGELAMWDSLSSTDEIAAANRCGQEVFQSTKDDSPDDAERRDILDELKRRHGSEDEDQEQERGDSERERPLIELVLCEDLPASNSPVDSATNRPGILSEDGCRIGQPTSSGRR